MFCTKYFDVFTCGDRQMCTLKYTCTYIHTNMHMNISACLSGCTVTHSLWATHSCCLIHFSFSALALGNLLEQHIHTHTTHTYIYVCMFVVFFFLFWQPALLPLPPVVAFRRCLSPVFRARSNEAIVLWFPNFTLRRWESSHHLIYRIILGLSVRQIKPYTHTIHCVCVSKCASRFVTVKLNWIP